jgi:uncharacterized protein
VNAGKPTCVSAKCPLCGKTRDEKLKPFCSKRCADIDLGRWLNGTYAITVTETDDSAEGVDEAPPYVVSTNPAQKN